MGGAVSRTNAQDGGISKNWLLMVPWVDWQLPAMWMRLGKVVVWMGDRCKPLRVQLEVVGCELPSALGSIPASAL